MNNYNNMKNYNVFMKRKDFQKEHKNQLNLYQLMFVSNIKKAKIPLIRAQQGQGINPNQRNRKHIFKKKWSQCGLIPFMRDQAF